MLNKDFKEFAELLNSTGVEYMIVGGYALAAHGHPRYTGDLDVWVGQEPGNIARLLNALAAFGFGSLGFAGYSGTGHSKLPFNTGSRRSRSTMKSTNALTLAAALRPST
jgi:hypothetical protein